MDNNDGQSGDAHRSEDAAGRSGGDFASRPTQMEARDYLVLPVTTSDDNRSQLVLRASRAAGNRAMNHRQIACLCQFLPVPVSRSFGFGQPPARAGWLMTALLPTCRAGTGVDLSGYPLRFALSAGAGGGSRRGLQGAGRGRLPLVGETTRGCVQSACRWRLVSCRKRATSPG